MKSFRFSLQTLLDHTQDREDEQKIKMARIQNRLREKQEQIATLAQDMQAISLAAGQKASQGATAFDLRHADIALARLREQQIERQKEAARIEKEREACRKILLAIRQEIKSLEKLRQRQHETYQAEAAREKEKEIEEFVSSRSHQAAAAKG